MCLARLDDHGAFTQAVGESDLDLPRHEQGGLESCLGGESLVDPPDAATENTEYYNDGGEKYRDLLLAKAHTRGI